MARTGKRSGMDVLRAGTSSLAVRAPMCAAAEAAAFFEKWFGPLRAAENLDFPAETACQVLRSASAGDLDSLRRLADAATLRALANPATDSTGLLMEGLGFARLAATRSSLPGDKFRVAAMLALVSRNFLPVNSSGESLAWVEALADGGDEDAASFLVVYSPHADPSVIEVARALRPVVQLLFEQVH